MAKKGWLVLIVILTVSYISLIFNVNIWTDEAYTIQLVEENGLFDMIRITADDVHPPLYYLIVKLFVTVFGSKIAVYKMVSVIPMILTMLLSWWWVRSWFGMRVAVFHILFLNAIPCVLEYVVQIRMYSWALFFVTVCGLAAYRIWNTVDENPKNALRYWSILFLGAMAACYTHNFAMISAFFIYVLLGIFVFRKIRRIPAAWFLSGILIGIGYLPWLFVLLRQTTTRVGNYWIEEITAATVLRYPADIFGSEIPFTTGMFLVLSLIALWILIKRIREDEEKSVYAILLAAVPLLTMLTGVAVSVLVTPFFIARYLIPCMGLVALAFAIPFANVKKTTRILLGVFLGCMIIASYHENYKMEYVNSSTEELLEYMDTHMGENDLIVYNYQIFGFIYERYFDSEKMYFLEEIDFGSDFENVWYFDSCISPWLSDAVLEEHDLKKEFVLYTGIEQNDFLLYRIYR